MAVARPSVLDPHWNECRPNPLCPLSPHGQRGRSCFCPGSGGRVKVRDELLGALMCSKGTKVRTAITFSFFSPGDCGVIPGEVRHKCVAGGGLVKRAAELLRWASSPPGPFLSFVTALSRYNSHPIHLPCLKDIPVVLASLQSYVTVTTISFQDTVIELKTPSPLDISLLTHPPSLASLISLSLFLGSLFWLAELLQGPPGWVGGFEPSFPCPWGLWGRQVKG